MDKPGIEFRAETDDPAKVVLVFGNSAASTCGTYCAGGWSTWKGSPTDRLKTATYAEYNSSGPGANASARGSDSKQLTKDEAERYETKVYLTGGDGWDPTKVR